MLTLTIPRVPLSMNRLLGRHWSVKNRERKLWMQEIQCAYGHGSPQCSTKMRVTITLHHPRLFDTDNAYGACKVILDALKLMGFIVDDKPKWLEEHVLQVQCHKSQAKTIILLTEIPR